MLSSYISSGLKCNFSKESNIRVRILIIIFLIFGLIFLIISWREFYKLNSFILRQCQINSLDLKYKRRSYFPRWNITFIENNLITNDFIIDSTSTTLEKWAWIKARKYKINETYPCYRSTNEKSFLHWNWQWNKPNKLKAFTFLFGGILIICLSTSILILITISQRQFRKIREEQDQQELETVFTDEEQSNKTTSPLCN